MISQRYLTTSPSEQLSSNTYTTLKTGALESRILSPEGLVEPQRSPALETGTNMLQCCAEVLGGPSQ